MIVNYIIYFTTIYLRNRDVYLNVVGGLRVFEPSADLAVAVTVISSLLRVAVQPATAFIGK